MKLLALTFLRSSELVEAIWAEIDFEAAELRIPPERMKMKRPHIIPLAPQAVQVLRTLQVVSGRSELLFPGERDRKKPMSNNTILKALERIGYKGRMTGHGFRGLASTALYERQFPSDHIELQLAHVRGKVRGAYDHSRQLPQRRSMMEFWAGYLDSCLADDPRPESSTIGSEPSIRHRPPRICESTLCRGPESRWNSVCR
jgi:integrase